MIDCIALSDLHGKLPKIDLPFDLMLIAGDVIDLFCQRYPKDSEDWYLGEFVDWINNLPFKDEQSRVVLIAGNHDVGIERMPESNKDMFLVALRRRSNNRIIYLENELYNFHCAGGQISVFGTPYCKIFGNWAFMLAPDYLKQKYAEIPEGIDILLTHDAPSINNVGTILQETTWSDGTLDAGNPQLTDIIFKRTPTLVLCGHIHSGNHGLTQYMPGKYIRNVSILNECYEEEYTPFYFSWPLSD